MEYQLDRKDGGLRRLTMVFSPQQVLAAWKKAALPFGASFRMAGFRPGKAPLEILEKRMEELGLNKEDYQFYLDLRRYGSARHAGFGLGFERCVMYITGMGNIRDVIPFPRTVNNCDL